MGNVVGGNPKAEGRVGGEDLVVIYDEVGNHREQVVINEHKITSGRNLGVRGYTSVFPWGLSPDLGLGSQVNPSFSGQKTAENGNVPRLSVEVPTNARRPSGVGRNLLANGFPDEISFMGLALVSVASREAVCVVDKHIMPASNVYAKEGDTPSSDRFLKGLGDRRDHGGSVGTEGLAGYSPNVVGGGVGVKWDPDELPPSLPDFVLEVGERTGVGRHFIEKHKLAFVLADVGYVGFGAGHVINRYVDPRGRRVPGFNVKVVNNGVQHGS
jgi:hypothetical protein